ncbi:transcriptional regulator [Blautia producta]|uniref:Transcriptional regulator n=3 Tax=Blautia producta TaxID=33035 RepID=A0A7G5N3L0_9FIRM|nr:helix-turn-helix transcriptional regulator [Blautia producta ATCC 27340 = DSM 2950]QMW81453.1 transcriptional regulator [Blautia producta]
MEKEENNAVCPLKYALNLVGGKWKLPIICILAREGSVRYNSLKRKLSGITNMMLSQSLKELEENGIVHREQYNEIPPRVEYSLTKEGRSILEPLDSLSEWGKTHMKKMQTHSPYCRECGEMK